MKQITKYVCKSCGKEFLFKTDCEAHEAMHDVISYLVDFENAHNLHDRKRPSDFCL